MLWNSFLDINYAHGTLQLSLYYACSTLKLSLNSNPATNRAPLWWPELGLAAASCDPHCRPPRRACRSSTPLTATSVYVPPSPKLAKPPLRALTKRVASSSSRVPRCLSRLVRLEPELISMINLCLSLWCLVVFYILFARNDKLCCDSWSYENYSPVRPWNLSYFDNLVDIEICQVLNLYHCEFMNAWLISDLFACFW